MLVIEWIADHSGEHWAGHTGHQATRSMITTSPSLRASTICMAFDYRSGAPPWNVMRESNVQGPFHIGIGIGESRFREAKAAKFLVVEAGERQIALTPQTLARLHFR